MAFSFVQLAQAQPRLAPVLKPLDLAALQAEESSSLNPGICPAATSVVTAKTICQTRITIPSLWWAKEQFGGKLLENWLAYAGDRNTPGRVDLVVNPQVWSLLNYLERYEFINHFGTAARGYAYNTRVFNRQGVFLGSYTCDFGSVSSNSPQAPSCKILLDSTKRDALRGRPANSPL